MSNPQSVKLGLTEVQEIVLARSRYSMNVPASTANQFQSVAHNLNLTPFIDYMISADGGATFYDPTQFQTIDSLIYVDAFCDNVNINFSYHYSSGSPANPALSLVFKFRLFVTEATAR